MLPVGALKSLLPQSLRARRTEASAGPVDKADVQAPPPDYSSLWKEAAKCGLIGTRQAVTGPMGAMLSALAQQQLGEVLADLEQHGVQLTEEHWTPGSRPTFTPIDAGAAKQLLLERDMKYIPVLNAQAPGADRQTVRSIDFLRTLHTLEVRQTPDDLEKPELAKALGDLEAAGIHTLIPRDGINQVRHYDDPDYVWHLGTAGAYQKFVDDDRTGPSCGWYIWMAKPGEDAIEGKSEADVLTTAYFQVGSSVASLDANANASTLRGGAAAGLQFFGDDNKALSPRALFDKLEEDGAQTFKVGVGWLPMDTVTVEDVRAGKLSPRLSEAVSFYQQRLQPRVAAGEMTEEDAQILARGCSHPIDTLDIDTRYARLQELVDLEQSREPNPRITPVNRAVANLELILKERKPGETFGQVVASFRELREQMNQGVARQCFVHLRNKVRPEAFNEKDYETERTRIVELAKLAHDDTFEVVQKAREALSVEMPGESYGVRLDALQRLNAVGEKLPSGDRWKGPMSTAIKAYDAVIKNRNEGETLAQATETLGSLATALVPQIGWDTTLQTFAWLQRGLRCDAFHGAAPQAAVQRLVQHYLLNQDLDAAREHLKASPAGARGSIDDDAEELNIGGLTIRR